MYKDLQPAMPSTKEAGSGFANLVAGRVVHGLPRNSSFAKLPRKPLQLVVVNIKEVTVDLASLLLKQTKQQYVQIDCTPMQPVM